MQLWKKRLQRVAAMVCTLAMVASMLPTAAFAEANASVPEATSTVEESGETSKTPATEEKTTESPAPSADPT